MVLTKFKDGRVHFRNSGMKGLKYRHISLLVFCYILEPAHVKTKNGMCADAQADLSLRWAHMPFCRFCHALAHICEANDVRFFYFQKKSAIQHVFYRNKSKQTFECAFFHCLTLVMLNKLRCHAHF